MTGSRKQPPVDLTDLALVAGAICITIGAFQLAPWAGWIVLGLSLSLGSIFAAFVQVIRKPDRGDR